MTATTDAQALVKTAEAQLPHIRRAYEAALHEKEISADLRVSIKNFMENIRSALDFCACAVFEKYGHSKSSKPRIYFPYALASQDRATFVGSGRIETCIPGLAASRPDIVTALIELQHFGSRGYTWLPEFMELTNENKHQRLTPQVRKEQKELRISGGGASIGIGEGASISIGPGASISIGGAIIQGGQTFGVGHPPRVQGGTVETIVWVSFLFETTGRPVLPFLETVLGGAKQIVVDLAAA